MAGNSDRYKVRLVSVVDPTNNVVFDVTPTLTESGGVDYSQVAPVHLPGAIQIYRHTNPRQFSVGATLVSRTIEEATANMKRLQMLRAWRFPYFGTSSKEFDSQQNAISRVRSTSPELRGAPPEVLYLYGYSSPENSLRRSMVNLNKIPVVLQTLDITWPDDVDYLPTNNNNEPFPTRMQVSLSLAETHSPREFETFSLDKYRAGKLVNF